MCFEGCFACKSDTLYTAVSRVQSQLRHQRLGEIPTSISRHAGLKKEK